MTWLRNALVCALLGSLILLALRTAELIRTVRGTVAILPVVTHAAVREQGELTRQAALTAIADVRRETLAEVAHVRTDLLSQTDRKLSALNATVAANLERANDSLAQVAGVATAARPVLANATAITAHVNEASAVLLRRDALPAQILGISGAAKRALGETALTMIEVRKVAPATAKAVQEGAEAGRDLARSGASIARSWEKQTPIYFRVGGWIARRWLDFKTLFR